MPDSDKYEQIVTPDSVIRAKEGTVERVVTERGVVCVRTSTSHLPSERERLVRRIVREELDVRGITTDVA